MIVRAKFLCDSITDTKDGRAVELRAVSDGSEENKQFFKWTPMAKVSMSILNPDAAKQFEPGKSYYVDFTVAE